MATFKSSHIVFSAPSGAGKTTIVKKLLEKYPEKLALSVSATTRRQRPGEKNNVDYVFLSQQQFDEAVRQNAFLEFEEVHGNYYGTLKSSVDQLTVSGKSVLFDIDVKGALSIKRAYSRAMLIFIKPPSMEALKERLRKRKSEDENTISKRLQRIDYEYGQAQFFDYVVINDNLKDTVQQVEEIIRNGQA